MPIILNEKIPYFSIETVDFKGNIETFTPELALNKIFVLYFYPRDLTSGCTKEAQDFAAKFADFQKANAFVLGISRDTIARHKKFIEKENLPFPLAADPNEEVCNLFGVIQPKKMYGKDVRGIVRSTFLFDENGVLRQQWLKVKIPNHVDEVLQAVLELNQ